jgi:hypothetical protein
MNQESITDTVPLILPYSTSHVVTLCWNPGGCGTSSLRGTQFLNREKEDTSKESVHYVLHKENWPQLLQATERDTLAKSLTPPHAREERMPREGKGGGITVGLEGEERGVQVMGQGGEGGHDLGPDAGEALPAVLRHPLAVDEPLLEASEGDVDGDVPDLHVVVHRGGGETVADGGRGQLPPPDLAVTNGGRGAEVASWRSGRVDQG